MKKFPTDDDTQFTSLHHSTRTERGQGLLGVFSNECTIKYCCYWRCLCVAAVAVGTWPNPDTKRLGDSNAPGRHEANVWLLQGIVDVRIFV